MATVVLLGTLDTKGVEYAFLKRRIEESGCDVIMVNAGVLGDPDFSVDYTRNDVARAAGSDLGSMEKDRDRGAAVTTMARGAAAIVQRIHSEGRLHGILGAGGSAAELAALNRVAAANSRRSRGGKETVIIRILPDYRIVMTG